MKPQNEEQQPSAIYAGGEAAAGAFAARIDQPKPTTEIPIPVDAVFDLFDGDDDDGSDEDQDLLHLVRTRLGLGDDISDVTIAASLAAIAAKSEQRARWLVAFSSPLGKCLAARGGDLNTALDALLALAPKPVS
jgi:hypothetical protein